MIGPLRSARTRGFGVAMVSIGALCVASALRAPTPRGAPAASRAISYAAETQIPLAWAGPDAGGVPPGGACVPAPSASFHLLIDQGSGPAPLANPSFTRAFVTVRREDFDEDHPDGVLRLRAVGCFYTLHGSTAPRHFVRQVMVCEALVRPTSRTLVPGYLPRCQISRSACNADASLVGSASEGTDFVVRSWTDTSLEVQIPRVSRFSLLLSDTPVQLTNIVFRASQPGGGLLDDLPAAYRMTP